MKNSTHNFVLPSEMTVQFRSIRPYTYYMGNLLAIVGFAFATYFVANRVWQSFSAQTSPEEKALGALFVLIFFLAFLFSLYWFKRERTLWACRSGFIAHPQGLSFFEEGSQNIVPWSHFKAVEHHVVATQTNRVTDDVFTQNSHTITLKTQDDKIWRLASSHYVSTIEGVSSYVNYETYWVLWMFWDKARKK